MTCFSQRQRPFHVYISPFNQSLWALLGLTMLALVGSLCIIYTIKELNFSVGSGFLMILAPLLLQTVKFSGRLQKDNSIKLQMMTWFIVSNVLTNTYLSFSMTDVVSPVKQIQPQYFHEFTKLPENCDYLSDMAGELKNCPLNLWMKHVNNESGARPFDPRTDFKLYSRRDETSFGRLPINSSMPQVGL